ncbi:MAG: hypothetical protein HC919_14490 [Oscillatoriales cyanobacterium SM2_2_1]|nr:hypothetical protein [Oscillatoriales cyanobacterium SM2_2_1]
MLFDRVRVKPDTRNHQGFFVLETSYKLVNADCNGWALICLDDHVCHYVDPDDLKITTEDHSNATQERSAVA